MTKLLSSGQTSLSYFYEANNWSWNYSDQWSVEDIHMQELYNISGILKWPTSELPSGKVSSIEISRDISCGTAVFLDLPRFTHKGPESLRVRVHWPKAPWCILAEGPWPDVGPTCTRGEGAEGPGTPSDPKLSIQLQSNAFLFWIYYLASPVQWTDSLSNDSKANWYMYLTKNGFLPRILIKMLNKSPVMGRVHQPLSHKAEPQPRKLLSSPNDFHRHLCYQSYLNPTTDAPLKFGLDFKMIFSAPRRKRKNT